MSRATATATRAIRPVIDVTASEGDHSAGRAEGDGGEVETFTTRGHGNASAWLTLADTQHQHRHGIYSDDYVTEMLA